MDVRGVSLFENLILRLKSVASSVVQIFELTGGKQQKALKRAQLCSGKLLGPFTPLEGEGAAGKCLSNP